MADRPHGYLSDDEVRMLSEVSTATITTQLLKRDIKTGFMEGVKPLRPDLRMVGYAFTLRYIPAREDLGTGTNFDNSTNPQRIAVESVGNDDVLVVDARGELGAATLGDILITRMKVRGAAGVVTDGAFRDAPGIAEIELPTYAGGAHAYLSAVKHHPVDINQPVGCGGVAVIPGDVIVGDGEGVVVIPAAIASEVARDSYEQERYESWVMEKVEAGESIQNIYPQTEESRARFNAESGK